MNHRDTEGTEKRQEQRGMESSITSRVIGAAIEVHRALGPGLLESAYEQALCHELRLQNLAFTRQQSLPIHYKGVNLGCDFRTDLIVMDFVVVELKAVERLLPIHDAQLLTYLKLTGLTLGLLVNFNVPVLRDGIRRFRNGR